MAAVVVCHRGAHVAFEFPLPSFVCQKMSCGPVLSFLVLSRNLKFRLQNYVFPSDLTDYMED